MFSINPGEIVYLLNGKEIGINALIEQRQERLPLSQLRVLGIFYFARQVSSNFYNII